MLKIYEQKFMKFIFSHYSDIICIRAYDDDCRSTLTLYIDYRTVSSFLYSIIEYFCLFLYCFFFVTALIGALPLSLISINNSSNLETTSCRPSLNFSC